MLIDSNIVLKVLRDYNRSLTAEVLRAKTDEELDFVAGKVRAVSEILVLVENMIVLENKREVL